MSTPEPTPTILIDTREQCPLDIQAYSSRREGLPVGDYGIAGFSNWENPQFVVERKSLDDLVSSLTQGRDRFMREITKLRQFGFAAVVIEGTCEQVERGQYRSKATPQSVVASLLAIQVRHNIHVIWAGDRDGAARTVEQLVRQFVRGIEKQAKQLHEHT